MKKELRYDRFDVVEAWFAYLMEYHNGPDSWEYKRLRKLCINYQCGIWARENPVKSLGVDTNARRIYDRILKRFSRDDDRTTKFDLKVTRNLMKNCGWS